MEWKSAREAPSMLVLFLHHPYYSHGQIRQGYLDMRGEWIGVNADGTEGPLTFAPYFFTTIPNLPQ